MSNIQLTAEDTAIFLRAARGAFSAPMRMANSDRSDYFNQILPRVQCIWECAVAKAQREESEYDARLEREERELNERLDAEEQEREDREDTRLAGDYSCHCSRGGNPQFCECQAS